MLTERLKHTVDSGSNDSHCRNARTNADGDRLQQIRLMFEAAQFLTAMRLAKNMLFTITFCVFACLSGLTYAQISFTERIPTETRAWNATRWNNTADTAPYTSSFIAGNNVDFTSGSYSFAGMGAAINVGNVTVQDGVTVSFSTDANTYATGGNIRTFDIGTGGNFDFGSQAISTASGTGFIKNGAGTLRMSTGSTYGGGFTLNQGTVSAAGATSFGSGTLTINGGFLASGTHTFQNNISLSGNVALVSSVGGGSNTTFNGNVNIGNATRTITTELNATSTRTFAGNISGTGTAGLTFENSNPASQDALIRSVILSGTNNYLGATTVNGGTLQLSNGSAIADSGSIVMANSARAALRLNSSETIGSLSGGGNAGGNVNLQSNTLTVAGSDSTTYSGIISGNSGALTKTGDGTLTLTGANSYTGATTVSNGTLTVNGSLANTAVTVASGATLNGSGSLGGPVTVDGTLSGNGTTFAGAVTINGTHAVGTSPGLQTANGGLTYNSGSVFEWELIDNTVVGRGTAFDAVNGLGVLAFNGSTTSNLIFANSFVNWNNPFWGSNQTWTVFQGFSNVTGTPFNTINVGVDGAGNNFGTGLTAGGSFAWSASGGNLLLNYTAVAIPEPSSILVLSLIGGLGLYRNRHRLRRGTCSSL